MLGKNPKIFPVDFLFISFILFISSNSNTKPQINCSISTFFNLNSQQKTFEMINTTTNHVKITNYLV